MATYIPEAAPQFLTTADAERANQKVCPNLLTNPAVRGTLVEWNSSSALRAPNKRLYSWIPTINAVSQMGDSVWSGVMKARRDEQGMTQAELGRRAGVPKGTFQRYESGEREPPLLVARAIAEALDITIAELAGQVPAGIDPSLPLNLSAVGEVMQARRRELGLTQTRAASAVGVALDLYQRYESGELEPTLSTAASIAGALDLTLATLAGTEPRPIDFTRQWWAMWEGDRERGGPNLHTVNALRAGDVLLLDQGWRGQLQIFGNDILTGWYRPPNAAIRGREGVFLWAPAGAEYLYGRWSGVTESNSMASGWCVLAKDETTSREIFNRLVTGDEQPRPALQLPPLAD